MSNEVKKTIFIFKLDGVETIKCTKWNNIRFNVNILIRMLTSFQFISFLRFSHE